MDRIGVREFDFSTLEKLKYQGTTSTIYRDGNICVKMLDGLYEDEREALYRKLIDMDGIEIPNVLLPKDLLLQNGKLRGYTMDYFQDSIPLADRFMTRYVDCKQLFDYVSKTSTILKSIHDKGIICQDLSFENILVDNNGNVVFCDIDACNYKDHMQIC